MDFSVGSLLGIGSPSALRLPSASSGARVACAIGIAAFLLASAMQPSLPIDAAAGALVRAERFGAGGGGAVTDGVALSDPIGTVLLVGARAVGMDVLVAGRVLTALNFGVSVAALSALVRAAGGNVGAAFLAASLACLWAPFRAPLLASSGLGATTALCFLAMLVAIRGRPRFTGVLFGLALFESPIAFAALVGPIAASLWITGSLPRQIVASAGLTYLAATTLRLFAGGWPAWGAGASEAIDLELNRDLLGGAAEVAIAVLLVTLAAARVYCAGRRDEPSEIVAISAGAWSAIGLAFTLSGAWQPIVASASISPPLLLLAATAPAALARRVGRRVLLATQAAWSLAGIALIGALLAMVVGGSRNAGMRRAAFDRDLLDAGRWLAGFADDAETVASTSRWALFGARDLDVRRTPLVFSPGNLGGNEDTDYLVRSGQRSEGRVVPPSAPPGFVPLAIFDSASRRFDDLPWVTVFGRTTSQAASTGVRAFTLRDLGPYAPIPDTPEPKAVEWRGADLFEHPSGGLRFQVPSEGRRFSIRFRPAYAPDAQREQSDGITFELRAGGLTRFRTFLYPTDPEPEHVVRVVDGVSGEEATLDLLVGVGPAQNGLFDWALWRGVRIYVEGADPSKLREPLPADGPETPPGEKVDPDTRSSEEELIR